MILSYFDSISEKLYNFLNINKSIYLHTEPEIVDFRKKFDGQIILSGAVGDVSLSVPQDELFLTLMGILMSGMAGKTLYTWDIKRLFSYIYYRFPRHKVYNIEFNVIDLKYGEAFKGIDEKRPLSLREAEERIWGINMDVMKKIHVPLATRVLPKVETLGMCDVTTGGLRHATYEIEGQTNGRLCCKVNFKGGLSVHNMSAEEKVNLRPSRADNLFLSMDYKAMEVCILQWLSGDERLGKIVASGKDVYSIIFSLLYGRKCEGKDRKFIKDTFLPIMYGLQAKSLSEATGVSVDAAEELIGLVKKYFGTAHGWMSDKYGDSVDCYGRKRSHPDKPWAARNAVIQGPAAMICLEKLIELSDALDVAEITATVHDGYFIDVPKNNLTETVFKSISVLEKNNLKLRVEIKVGKDLANLNPYHL